MLTKGFQRTTDRVCSQHRKNTVCIEHITGFLMGLFFEKWPRQSYCSTQVC